MKILLILCFIISTTVGYRLKRSLGNYLVKPWTNNTIPYILDSVFTESDLFYINKAFETYEKETCLKFVPYAKNVHPNWVILQDSGRCHSEIGMSGSGQQVLALSKPCRSYGLILHELAHTFGLLHEMMRPDRNQYMTYFEKNIQEEAKISFAIEHNHFKLFNSPFDFQSVTMYSPYDFSKNGLPVWTKLNKSDTTPIYENRERDLSFWDSLALNALYTCDKNCNKSIECSSPGFINKNCECITAEDYADSRCIDDPMYKEICQNASITDLCYNRPGISSVICRKTCGRCFQYGSYGNSTAPPYSCTDLNEFECKKKALDGYCFVDTWTKVNCRKTCDLCQDQQDQLEILNNVDENSCRNLHDNVLCDDWAERGQCDINPSFMLARCALSCQVCVNNSTNDTESNSKQLCRNFSPDSYCDVIAQQNKCKGTTLKVCLGSCGKCGDNYERNEPNVTEHEIAEKMKKLKQEKCDDKMPDCKHYVKIGYCQAYRESMDFHCSKSCGACEARCEDREKFDVCLGIEQRGLCVTHAGFADRCRKTCGVCKEAANRIQIYDACQDQESRYICREVVRRRLCIQGNQCKKSCGLCKPGNTTVPPNKQKKIPNNYPCNDEDSFKNCQNLKNTGNCQKYIERALMCRRSCDLCPFTTTKISITTKSPIVCKDKIDSSLCDAWYSTGYCDQNKEYMLENCAKTCKFCHFLQKAECNNKKSDEDCKTWADQGYCQSKSIYMSENCQKACKTCNETADTSIDSYTKPCEDTEPAYMCKNWKDGGYCIHHNVAELCQLTCNACQ